MSKKISNQNCENSFEFTVWKMHKNIKLNMFWDSQQSLHSFHLVKQKSTKFLHKRIFTISNEIFKTFNAVFIHWIVAITVWKPYQKGFLFTTEWRFVSWFSYLDSNHKATISKVIRYVLDRYISDMFPEQYFTKRCELHEIQFLDSVMKIK